MKHPLTAGDTQSSEKINAARKGVAGDIMAGYVNTAFRMKITFLCSLFNDIETYSWLF